MQFLVGYQFLTTDDFLNEIIKQKQHIREVYFSWGDMPNGRHAAAAHATLPAWEVKARMQHDLTTISDAGIECNLLLNGNCYGGRALSRDFLTHVCEDVDEVGEKFRLTSVTTTSPVLAHLIKTNFPQLEVRASVNMEIDTVAGMEYIENDFDGFYLGRELNRDIAQMKVMSDWCHEHGKKAYLLANSGCLNHCSARQFHDNLVSHEREIMAMDNGVNFHGICRDYLTNAENKDVYLRRLNFIRPEDMYLYKGLVSAAKLATRVNPNPTQILRAYIAGQYAGNLLNLLEPDHAEGLYPYVLENRKLPADFGKQISACGHICDKGGACNYCERAVNEALVRLPDYAIADSSDHH